MPLARKTGWELPLRKPVYSECCFQFRGPFTAQRHSFTYSFFVWPKLLAASFALMAFGLILRGEGKPVDVGLGATCLSLGLLSHTGVGLTIIPIAIFAASTRGAPGWKRLATIC